VQLTTSSCFVFGADSSSYTLNIDPEQPLQPLVLQATAVAVSGEVVVLAGTGSNAGAADSTDSSSNSSFSQDISITVAAPGQTNHAAQIIQAFARDPAKPGVYSYNLTVDLGASVVLTPSLGDSSSLLLYPRSRVYKHDASSKECPPAVAAFEAKPGRMLSGLVEPAVEGACNTADSRPLHAK
jgi:hypothetical protein